MFRITMQPLSFLVAFIFVPMLHQYSVLAFPLSLHSTHSRQLEEREEGTIQNIILVCRENPQSVIITDEGSATGTEVWTLFLGTTPGRNGYRTEFDEKSKDWVKSAKTPNRIRTHSKGGFILGSFKATRSANRKILERLDQVSAQMMIFYTYSLLLELQEFGKNLESGVSDVDVDLGSQGIFMHRMHLLLSRGGSGAGLLVNNEDLQRYQQILTRLPFDYKKPPSERVRSSTGLQPGSSPLQLVQFFLIRKQNRHPFRCFKEGDIVGRDESWTFALTNTAGGLWGLQTTKKPDGTWIYVGEEKRNYVVPIKKGIAFYAIPLGSLKVTPGTVKTVLKRFRQVPADVNLLYLTNLYEAAEEMAKSPEFFEVQLDPTKFFPQMEQMLIKGGSAAGFAVTETERSRYKEVLKQHRSKDTPRIAPPRTPQLQTSATPNYLSGPHLSPGNSTGYSAFDEFINMDIR
ncbi:hypothetical protein F5051DRAFT_503975 [Lentinula edodes]|nr:hypothetical protein F5051DRAFT_503975 [Lentinula edodes]